MKANALWTRKFQSIVDNGRNQSLVIDLPESKGGTNSGPTAIELCVMSFCGCVCTVFTIIAQKMHINFDKLEINMDAEQKNNAPTISDVHCILFIHSTEEKSKIDKCLEHTLNVCPVGLLFKQAGINITHEINMLND